MNTRICAVVATVTLLALAPGCSGMRNFFSGRGARCGLCSGGNSGSSQDQCQPSTCQPSSCQPQPTCGCGGSYGSGYSGMATSDPYMGGEVVGSMPYPGQVIDVTEGVPDNFTPRTTP